MNLASVNVRNTMRPGALAEELPYWGYLGDDRTCLTRDGQMCCVARLTQSALDGRTPEALDAVLERWTRFLSNVEPGGRIHFYLLRRPVDSCRRRLRPRRETCRRSPGGGAKHSWPIVCRTSRPTWSGLTIPDYTRPRHANGRGPWWLNYCRVWLARNRAPYEAVYLRDEIEAAAEALPAARRRGGQARLRPDADRTVKRTRRGPFSLGAGQPARPGLGRARWAPD